MTEPARNRPSGLRRAQARAGYLFILPTAVLYTAFVLAPVVLTAMLAFSYYDPMMGSYWVGWDNFTRFFTDRRSLQILWNTLRFALLRGQLQRRGRPGAGAGAQPRDAGLAALLLPARLLPAGDHRRRLRLDRLELFLRRRPRGD